MVQGLPLAIEPLNHPEVATDAMRFGSIAALCFTEFIEQAWWRVGPGWQPGMHPWMHRHLGAYALFAPNRTAFSLSSLDGLCQFHADDFAID
jgi:hypothetical protein